MTEDIARKLAADVESARKQLNIALEAAAHAGLSANVEFLQQNIVGYPNAVVQAKITLFSRVSWS